MKKQHLTTRSGAKNLSYRTIAVRADDDGRPASLDVENRSVEVVGATENPVEVFDFERYEIVREILLMSGCEMPASRQVPLLDSHRRFDGSSSVLGSYRDMSIAKDQLIGRALFSSVEEAEGPYTKVREGHLTDFSAGYRPIKSVWVPEGQSAKVNGRTFEGPVKVTTRWRIKELSVCPIGADEMATARAEDRNYQRKKQEIEPMNKALRDYLIKRGMNPDASDDEAWEYYVRNLPSIEGDRGQVEDPPANAATPVPAVEDADAIREAAVRVERERVNEINAMCARFDAAELAQDMIDKGRSLDACRQRLIDHLANKGNPPLPSGPATIENDERDKFRDAAQDSLILRSGIVGIEKPAPGARSMMGFSLRELARECLRLNNEKAPGNIMELVGRAMMTNDFPLILANTANKSLFEGWQTAEETWMDWVGTGSVSDFKTHTLPRLSEADDLDEVPENVPYKYGKFTEGSESYSIATYGKLFAITRQAIINDDLGALTKIPMAHGESAARKVGDVVYAVLTANAAMGDGIALFHASHGNFVDNGSGAVPGVATIAAGILAMKTQKDLQNKRRLNIRPEYLIAPAALEGAAEVFFRSEMYSDPDTIATDSSLASSRNNPYAGNYLSRVYEPRLDDDDAAAWYLAARKGRTVVAFFLNGMQEPYMETKQGFTVDGVEYKVRIDVGAKAVDWRGLYFNDGN